MKRILFILTVFMIASSCSNVMITGRRQLLLLSDSEILSMSATAYKQYIDSVPASLDMAATEMVKRVGTNISLAVEAFMLSNRLEHELAKLAWEFNLVADSTVNAFCMPGGKVVFFEGILPYTKTEAGLAVVMGHEIAHAVAKHSNERMSQVLLAQYGAVIADILTSNRSETTRSVINTVYGIGATVGVILPYSRKHEYEADRLGTIFMAMAGYDPNEAIEFWSRMASSKSKGATDFLSTHPTDAKRIAKLREVIPEAMRYMPQQ